VIEDVEDRDEFDAIICVESARSRSFLKTVEMLEIWINAADLNAVESRAIVNVAFDVKQIARSELVLAIR